MSLPINGEQRMVRFVRFTEIEGGDWHDCDFSFDTEGLVPLGSPPDHIVHVFHTLDGDHAHALKTEDGRVWDVDNGWR